MPWRGLERGLEKLGLAVREGWEVESGLAEGDGATITRGSRGIVSRTGRGTYTSLASNGSSE
jgi:hypothetical protein